MPRNQLTERQIADIQRRIAANDPYPAIAADVGCTLDNVKYYARTKKPIIERVREAFAPQLAAERAERDAERQRRTEAPILAGLREADGRTDVSVWLASEIVHLLKTDGFYAVGFGGIPQFKTPEVQQLRGALDDAAKETGGRKGVSDVNVKHSGAVGVKDEPTDDAGRLALAATIVAGATAGAGAAPAQSASHGVHAGDDDAQAGAIPLDE